MENYSGTWALALLYVLGGPLLGLFLPFITLPLAIYSFFARKPGRGLTGSRIAIWFAVVPFLFTLEMWYELITGQFVDGQPVNHNDSHYTMYEFIAIFDVVAFAASIASWVRQRMRRKIKVAASI